MNRQSFVVENYYPEFVKKILPKIESFNEYSICFLGFGENMKWLCRIFKEKSLNCSLYDWREEFIDYDCCGEIIKPKEEILKQKNPLIVICVETVDLLKDAIIKLVNSQLKAVPVILDFLRAYNPLEQEALYKEIYDRARKRAISVNSNDRLFNLLQLVEQTSQVEGEIVEFGSFSGGSGAIIAETLKKNNISKKIYLFDSYCGLPESPLGVDFRWHKAFMNNSYAEVKNAFKDLKNVEVIKGQIQDSIKNINFPIAFAHIDVDTYFAVKLTTEKIYPLLSKGGIILYDDYGFFPNCLPLTCYISEFVKKTEGVFKFFLPSNGYFVIKR